MFSNDQIDEGDLPRAADVAWVAMDPKFLPRLQTQAAIVSLVLLIALAVAHVIVRTALAGQSSPINMAYLWIALVLFLLVLVGWPLVSVPRIGYAVRDHDILYRSGVFWQTATVIPFNRIQHVEKSSTLLDRRFGIATLQLFTAGGSGGDLNIHGLPAVTAENLREFIIGKVGDTH